MNFAVMIQSMGFTGLAVMCCLLALSLYSISVIVDRHRRFRGARLQSLAFLPELDQCLKQGQLEQAIATARRHERSPVARVVTAGVSEFLESRESPVDPAMRSQLVERSLERQSARTLTEMKAGLGALATIGSTAPFIGLFGTIVGIIHAFQGIAESGSGGVAAVSGGIAEALVATALGILVAIPAVMAFNHFTVSLERFQVELNATSAELVDYLSKADASAHASR